ncbi:hypothetical protein LY632_04990 [Erythrobacter sp. SDW2]|uniref:hypothetical protein n=1 Tax=Erythrobacter sp. SDW2 TaxID=2907154 RepID=UPI001F265517|nr:hypothetical protein [Erythrobacter sp. SDW2]UIP07757.1 hypothetical protein LY632_04990 [Erythrobacter sp. SDW2]
MAAFTPLILDDCDGPGGVGNRDFATRIENGAAGIGIDAATHPMHASVAVPVLASDFPEREAAQVKRR